MERRFLRDHLARLYPGHELVDLRPLAPDAPAHDATAKAEGYGEPVRVTLAAPDGTRRELVWRVATANELGHDRRADRAAEILLAYDDFARIPDHVAPLDVGVVRASGELTSIRDYTELYLLTPYAPGTPYASDLRAVAAAGIAQRRDHDRATRLARYLAALHVPVADPAAYRRSIRDLVGGGEGIFGVVDYYPAQVAGAPAPRLTAIEQRCQTWRDRLRAKTDRLCRSHGDFHPFNLLFDGDALVVLDASRGTAGDPADDVTALCVNYILFALEHPGAWHGLGALWHRVWSTYLEARPDAELLAVAPPFFAWRALVVCNPRFYPALGGAARSALLGLAERALDAHHLEPAWADELFR